MSSRLSLSSSALLRPTAAALVLLLSLCAVVDARSQDLPRPSDPFADPKNDPYNPLKYIASNVLTAVAFALVTIVAVVQTVWMFKWGAKWMSAMTIGAYCFALGIGCRFGLHTNPESKGIYIVEYLFVVLSPCAFIAADYVLLGRLSRHLGAGAHLLIPPHRITLFFVISDVITFLIQAAGGSATISANDIKRIQTGEHIFLAGLALQLVSFLIFTCLFVRFLIRVRKHEPAIWTRDAGKKWYHDWRALAAALFVSCIGILIRSVYRTIEISQGFGGHLATTEGFFYALDTLPLWIAIVVYVPFWPGRFIPPLPLVVTDAQAARADDVERASADTTGGAPAPSHDEKVEERTPKM